MAISTRMSRSPVTPSAQSPSIGVRPSSSRPSSVKNSMAASMSSTTMPTLSIRLTVMMSSWRLTLTLTGRGERMRASGPVQCAVMRQPSHGLAKERVHTLGFDYGGRGGRRQVGDEGLGGFRFFRVLSDGCCENYFLLQLGGEGSDHIQTGGRQHVEEKHSQLGLTFGNRLNDLSRRGLYLGLGLHRLGDPEPIEHPKNLCTSRACRYGGDGSRFEQGLPQRFGRADVRLGSTRTNGNPEADASNVGCGPGREPRPGCGIHEHLPWNNTEVERSAGRGQLDQFGGRTEAENKFMARGPLELRAKVS